MKQQPPEEFVRAAPLLSIKSRLSFLYRYAYVDAQGFSHVSDALARAWIGCVPEGATAEEITKGMRRFPVYKHRLLSRGDFEIALFEDPLGHRHKGYRYVKADAPTDPVDTPYQRVGEEIRS
jgi:hypothetical protein